MYSATMHFSDFTVCGPPMTILTVGLSRSRPQFRFEDGRLAPHRRKMHLSDGYNPADFPPHLCDNSLPVASFLTA